jgi:hypothetical protein
MRPANVVVFARTQSSRLATTARDATLGSDVPRASSRRGTMRAMAAS